MSIHISLTRARVAQCVRLLDLTAHTSLSPIRHGFAPSFVNYKKGCTRLAARSDKVYQLLAHGRWFSPGTSASSTTKTGRHDVAEILLKMALSTINQIKSIISLTVLFRGNYGPFSNFVDDIVFCKSVLFSCVGNYNVICWWNFFFFGMIWACVYLYNLQKIVWEKDSRLPLEGYIYIHLLNGNNTVTFFYLQLNSHQQYVWVPYLKLVLYVQDF